MCGRFVGFRKIEELLPHFPIDEVETGAIENFNVAPTQEVLAIIRMEGVNRLAKLIWGLVPFWAGDPSIGGKLINARAESVDQKASFKRSFQKRRCLILADGFYEWMGKKGEKQPVFITLPDGSPFAFAGLWDVWHGKDEKEPGLKSCTIITTDASPSLRRVHHRMPVVLKKSAYDAWLDPSHQDRQKVKALLLDSIETEFAWRPVSRRVNYARNNGPENIQPLPGGE